MKQQVDKFYVKEFLNILQRRKQRQVLKFVFANSHRQAAFEKGLSHNKHLVSQSMETLAIVSRRLIKNHFIVNDRKPHTVGVFTKIVQHAK